MDTVSKEAVVSVCDTEGTRAMDLSWAGVDQDRLFAAAPWRTFRWVRGQRHYSGFYWAATCLQHVPYESRLELSRLIFADFDLAVTAMVAQPFLLSAVVEGRERRHVPDFLFQTCSGPVVVDVKPSRLLAEPNVAFCLDWTRRVVHSRGWRYEVWSEPPPAKLENLRFLAGFRRGWLFDPELVQVLAETDFDGTTIGAAIDKVPGWPRLMVRAALFHLLWIQRFTVDLDTVLSADHRLGPAR